MKMWYLLSFFFFYIWELTLSALRVALDVLTTKDLSSPGIIRFPLKASTDLEIMLLSNLITFSPGSMVVDFDKESKELHIHVMFLKDSEQAIHYFSDKIERRVLRLLR